MCFKSTGHKIITDSWYDERLPEDEERLRIVKTAACIILEDARSQVYETSQYPPADRFLDGAENLIPESLRVFTDAVVLAKKNGDINKWRKKSIAIADCLP